MTKNVKQRLDEALFALGALRHAVQNHLDNGYSMDKGVHMAMSRANKVLDSQPADPSEPPAPPPPDPKKPTQVFVTNTPDAGSW